MTAPAPATHNPVHRGYASTGRRDDIQGMRAIAVLAVVAFHAGIFVPGGFVGVDIFFVISGYVITAMLAREWATHGRIRFARFYVRRFKRLTPALALTVSVTVLASLFLLAPTGPQQSAAKTAIGATLLVANVVIARTTGDYFAESAENNPLLHTWSLSVEEQFYLVFPALLGLSWFWSRSQGPRQHLAAKVIAVVGISSLVLALAQALYGELPVVPEIFVGFYGPATRVWEFAAGALLALIPRERMAAAVTSRVAIVAAMVGGIGTAASLWLIGSDTPFPGPWTLLPVASTALLLVSGTHVNPVSAVLSSRPMVVVGDLSYSIYLWHWPFIVFGLLLFPGIPWVPAVAAVASFVPAAISYHLVEQPIRTRVFTRKQLWGLVTATVLPPLLLGGAMLIAAEKGYWNPTIKSYQAAAEARHLGAAAGCTREAWRQADECTWNEDADGTPVYMVGDSNADHFTEAIVEAGRALDRPVVGLTEDGCSYKYGVVVTDDPWSRRCAPYTPDTERSLLAAEPGMVLVSNSYPGRAITDAEAEQVVTRLAPAIAALQQAGHQVVIIKPIPHWGPSKESLSWRECSVLDMLGHNCSRSMELSEALAAGLETHWRALDTVASQTGAGVVNVTSAVCPGGVCESRTSGGLIRYRDGTHISVPQSIELGDEFTDALRSLSLDPPG